MVTSGYKQTELGLIPDTWDAKPLRCVLSKGRLGGNYPNREAGSEFPLMKMGNVARGHFDISKIEYISPGVTPESQHRLAYGDVLFNTRNTLDLVGKVAIWREELPIAYYNSNLMRLEFDASEVPSNEYANYALNTSASVSRLRALATGTTSVAAIYTRDLMKLQLIVPPKAEQRAIASALSDIDALLGELDRLIQKKCDLRTGAMQRLLTGQMRLPGFTVPWRKRRLGDVAEFCAGSYLAQICYREGKFEVQGAGGIMGYHEERNFSNPLSVVGRVGTIGHPRFFPAGCWVNNNAAAIVARKTCADAAFVHLLLLRFDWSKAVSITAQPFLVVPDLMNTEFLFPELAEQIAIALVLSDMDAEVRALEVRLEKTRNLKQAMMQALLTGRVRLADSAVQTLEPEAAHA